MQLRQRLVHTSPEQRFAEPDDRAPQYVPVTRFRHRYAYGNIILASRHHFALD
jgi:hypothetical protein